MEKKFNLINPPSIFYYRDYAYYYLARQLSLIAPDFFPIRVFINGTYMGVYMYLSQVDESLLRKHRLMPGSIYYGDGSIKLWFDPGQWVKKAARNREQKRNREDIELFISKINAATDQEFYDFIEEYLDKDKLFIYIALDRLYGSIHHDMSHNHKYYFDPYTGKFQPIAWDSRFWEDIENKDQSLYPLLLRLKANPVYDAAIDRVLFALLEQGYVEKSIELYRNGVETSKEDLESDKYKDSATGLPKLLPNPYSYSTPFTTRELVRQFQVDSRLLLNRKNYLYSKLNDVRVSLFQGSEGQFYVRVDGNSPVKIRCNKGISYSATIYGTKKTVNGSPLLYPGRKWRLGRLLYSQSAMSENIIDDVPLIYVLTFHGERKDEFLSGLEFFNDVTGRKISLENKDFALTPSESDVNPLEDQQVTPVDVRLSGMVVVTDQMVFPRNTTVSIAPGTTFLMDAGASIFFYGKVTAFGTEEKPIRFIAREPGKPWGIVAVQGKDATGSKFVFCQFQDGSVATHNLIHYTAPLNIHNVDWFELRNSRIGVNHSGDDSVHIAYARGRIDSCIFEEARSDGLDIDIGEVTITRSIFAGSGNDGLDIMTTKATITDCLFINTGDKGISIGEWSEAVLRNNIFVENEIGLEVKDKSRATAENLLFIDAVKKAINLYNKNKRYDEGGFLTGEKIYLLGNRFVEADKKSGLSVQSFPSLPVALASHFLHVVPDASYQLLVQQKLDIHAEIQ